MSNQSEARAPQTTIDAVRARLVTLLGKPARTPSKLIDDSEDGRLEWRGKPRVSFDRGDDLVVIGIGAAADDL